MFGDAPLQSPVAEETFQTLLASKALQKLGYDVHTIKEVAYPAAHIAVANGDAKFSRTGVYTDNMAMG